MADQLGLAANALIAVAYLGIFTVLATGLTRSRQWTTNALAVATALIFFSCGIGHGIHAEHLLLGKDADYDWHLGAWDALTGVVAVGYLSLRRRYGLLLGDVPMFEDLPRRRMDRDFRTAFEHAPIGIALVGVDGTFLRVNEALCDLLGRSDEELRTLTFHAVTHPEDLAADVELVASVLAGHQDHYRLEKRYLRPDGSVVHGLLSVALVRDEDGAPRHFISQIEDLTARRMAERESSEQREGLARAHRVARIGTWQRDLVTGRSTWSAEVHEVIGLDHTAGPDPERLLLRVHPEDRDRVARAIAMAYSEGVVMPLTFRVQGATGERVIASRTEVQRDADGRPVRLLGTLQDITDQVTTAESARRAEQLFATAFESAPIGMALLEPSTARVVQANPALASLVGMRPEELAGTRLTALMGSDDEERFAAVLGETATAGRPAQVELRTFREDGELGETFVSLAALEDDAQPLVVLQALDVTERKRFERQLQHLADHDALTGLMNRRRFEEELRRTIAATQRYGGEAALLMLDLDGFKYINDTLGHAVGDELIVRVGGVLRAVVRETDALARLGGDEFAILLPHADLAAATAVAEKALQAIRDEARVAAPDRQARVTASIGIARIDRQAPATADDALVEADLAMYAAKEDGRDCWRTFEGDAQHRERMDARGRWVARLQTAIEEERLELVAQPIVDLRGGPTDRYELLLRYRDDHGDLVPPGVFLYVAERTDLIGRIDRWVIGRAIGMLRTLEATGRDVTLSVNLSGRTIGDPALADDIEQALEVRPVQEGRLVFEVTETAAIVNIRQAQELAARLHALGCRFALDDFGAGFASFYYLKHLTFDYLKIDGEFVRGLLRSDVDQLVVRAIVAVARGLGTRTVAEYVGDDATADLLRRLGVDLGQGFHLGRPQPTAELGFEPVEG